MYPSRAFAVPSALAAALLLSTAFSGFGPAFAEDVEYVEIRSGKYKMTEYGETGEEIPRKGPVIEVYSSSGIEYDTIANDNAGLWFSIGLKGRCAGNQQIGKAELTLPEGGESLKFKKRRQSYSRGFKKLTVRSGFALPEIGRTPAQACMKELDKRVAGTSLSREEWIEHGFVVRYDDAYKLGFALTCNQGRGWNQFGEAETSAPVWIVCQPSKVAAAGARAPAATETAEAQAETRRLTGPAKPAQSSKPAETAEPEKLAEQTKPAALVSALALRANKEDYRGRCPVALRFSGAVTSNRAGVVRYRLVDHEGNSSPVRSLKFTAAGAQNIVGWSKAFSLPGEERAEGDAGPDYQGWVQIEIVEPRQEAASGRAAYRVTCE
jgi:hypothetical protein